MLMRAMVMVMVGLALGCGGASSEDSARPGSGSAGTDDGDRDRLDPPAAPGAMAPNLAPSPDGGALLTWLEPAARAGHRLRFSRLRGGAWSDPVTVAEGPSIVASWADVPSAAEADGGVVVAHWAEASPDGGSTAGGYDVVLARSSDGGATWRRLGVAHDDGTATEHGFVTLLPEGGRVRAFWLDGRETGSRNGAMTLRTALVGERVQAGELIDSRVCDCCRTSGGRTASGLLLAYRDRSGEEVRDISVVTGGDDDPGRPRGRGWSEPRTVHRDGWRIAGCPVDGPVVATAGDAAAAAWYTYAGQRQSVRVAFSRDGGASFAPPIEVDGPAGGRAPLGRVGLVLDRSGEALVMWVVSEGHEAEIRVRRVVPDGRLGPARRIARTRAGRGGGIPHMAAVAGDRLVLAWTEPSDPSRLRAALLSMKAIGPVGDAGGRAVASAGATAGPGPGEPAPPYRARSLAGAPVELAGLRGQVVLLNVWATWCGPCRQELVDLAALHRQRARDGLTIVAAAVDERDGRDKVAAFVRQRDLPFPVWLDPDDEASKRFGVRSLPTTLLIGRNGAIRWRREGVIHLDDREFRAALAAALDER